MGVVIDVAQQSCVLTDNLYSKPCTFILNPEHGPAKGLPAAFHPRKYKGHHLKGSVQGSEQQKNKSVQSVPKQPNSAHAWQSYSVVPSILRTTQ
eukprot:1160517-Pelagomonas_calceolata.AAC.3